MQTAHKANVPFRPAFDDKMVINPELEPGDMLIFTEAVCCFRQTHDSPPFTVARVPEPSRNLVVRSSTLSVGGGGVQLVHGTRNWQSDRPRRSILYKYSPGYSTWGNPEALAPARELASTELQRQLLRPPGVGGRETLALEEAGKWGDANARL